MSNKIDLDTKNPLQIFLDNSVTPIKENITITCLTAQFLLIAVYTNLAKPSSQKEIDLRKICNK